MAESKSIQAGDEQPSSSIYAWTVVGMLWCISFFNYADRQAIFSIFPLLQRQLHLSDVQLGAMGSAFAWVYGLGAPFAGAVADRVRRKRAILGGLYVWSVICMATAMARNFATLFFFRAAEGIGETFYMPATVSMLSDYHGPRTRSRALGLHQTSVYVGTIGGGFFAGYLGQRYGWRSSFIVFGVLGILLGTVLLKLLREPQRSSGFPDSPADAANETEGILFLKNPAVLLLMGAFVCANFVAMVLLSWMPMFLYKRFHLSLAMAGLAATSFAQLASMAGAGCGGWMADWLHRHTPRGRLLVQAIGVMGGAPFVVACGITHSVAWLIVVLSAWGFFKGLYDANIFASLFDVVPAASRGRAAGWMNMIGWLGGGGAAPLVIGLIAGRYGLGSAISAASAMYVLATVLLIVAAARYAENGGAMQKTLA